MGLVLVLVRHMSSLGLTEKTRGLMAILSKNYFGTVKITLNKLQSYFKNGIKCSNPVHMRICLDLLSIL